MTDTKEVIAALRASRSTWENARGVPSALETIAADTIEALAAKLAEVESALAFMTASRSAWQSLARHRLARAEAAETALATAPDALADGRPCSTDVWMAAALEQLDDKWDFFEACKDWVHGDWDGAMEGVTIRALTTEGKDND